MPWKAKKGNWDLSFFLDRKNRKFKLRKSLSIVLLYFWLRSVDKKRKPYQHDSEAMELVLRFLDRKQEAMHREYWGECSSATLRQPVGVRVDDKENKLIT